MHQVRASIAVLVLASAAALPAQTPEAPAPLAAARQALGETTLGGVASFTAKGSLTREIGGRGSSNDLAISCVLPDRFLRVTHRRESMGPLGSFDITDYDGFNATCDRARGA